MTPINKSVICTRGRSAQEVARELSKVIYLENYDEANNQSQLEKKARGKMGTCRWCISRRRSSTHARGSLTKSLRPCLQPTSMCSYLSVTASCLQNLLRMD